MLNYNYKKKIVIGMRKLNKNTKLSFINENISFMDFICVQYVLKSSTSLDEFIIVYSANYIS